MQIGESEDAVEPQEEQITVDDEEFELDEGTEEYGIHSGRSDYADERIEMEAEQPRERAKKVSARFERGRIVWLCGCQ